MLPNFIKGYRKVLTEDDMYRNRNVDDSQTLGNKLEAVWNQQLKNKAKPSLMNVLCTVFLGEFLRICIGAVIGEICRYKTIND